MPQAGNEGWNVVSANPIICMQRHVGCEMEKGWTAEASQEFLYAKKETLTCSKLLRTNVYFGVNCRPVSHPPPGLLERHWN